MIPAFTTRRRADAFDALVADPGSRDRADARDAEFLDLVASLRDLPPVQPRPEFVTALREQLMTAAETELVPSEEARLALPSRRPARDRRITVAVGGFALVGATASVAVAAQSALPGDLLYPVKRAIENAQAGVAPDDADKGTTLLASAAGRLDEAAALSREGRAEDGEAIAETLDSFTAQAREASELLLSDYAENGTESSVSDLRDFTSESMQTLAQLEGVVPADARDELLDAAEVLTQIDAAAARLCPSCEGLGITEIPAILTSPGLKLGNPPAVVEPASELQPLKKRERDREEQPPAPLLPSATGQPLPPGSVLGQPPTEEPQTGPDKSTGTEAPASNPLGDLTDDLLGGGGGGSGPASNQPALPGASELEEIIEGVTDPLLGTQKP